MEFRRGGQSNQRRRRVLKEDAGGDVPAASEAAVEPAPRRRRRSSALSKRTYTDAALLENQPRVTDLIPQRLWTFSVAVLGALSAVALVLALYAHSDWGARWLGEQNLAALDPMTRGSLSSWLSSALLGLAAVGSVAVFSIRRHRIDDYKGRYRVWLAMAVVCLLASIDATTALHRVPQQALQVVATRYAAGTSLGEYPGFWWIAFNLAAVVAIAARLSVEVRRSAGAAGWVVVAAASYLAAGAVELDFFQTPSPFVDVLMQAAAKLFADAALLFAVTAYARYVYLDSQGILAKRRAERLARKREAAAEREARKLSKAEARAAAQAEKDQRRADAERQKEEKRAAAAERRAAAKPEAAKTEAAKTEAEKTEIAKTQAAKSEGENRAAAKSESAKPEPIKSEAGKADVSKSATSKPATSPVGTPPVATPPSAPATPKSTPVPAAAAASAAAAAAAAASADQDDDSEDEDAEGDEQYAGMSRAERKRLKKLARRDNRRAA
jgi:hypothetical protein